MRLALTALGSLAAACSFSGGSVEDQTDGAPDVDASIDAPRPDGADPDRDNDGIDDGQDNCPDLANPSQENEDNDDRGNVCDVCPHIVDAGADADGDGVGDSCDPQPGMQNTWLLFEGFDAALVDAEWEGEEDFTVAGGRLVQADNSSRYYIRNLVVSRADKVAVAASMQWANPRPMGGPAFRYGGPYLRSSVLDVNNACWAWGNANSAAEGYVFMEETAMFLDPVTIVSGDIVDDQRYDILISIDGDTHTCAWSDGATTLASFNATTTTNSGGDRIGMVTSFTEMTVDFFLAVSLQ